MNEPFTTPQIPELIISYPFGGNIGQPSWRKNNHEESGLRSPSLGGTARGRRRDGSNNANRPPWGK